MVVDPCERAKDELAIARFHCYVVTILKTPTPAAGRWHSTQLNTF